MTKNGFKILLFAFLFSLPFWWGVNIFQKNLENFLLAEITQPFENMVSFEQKQKPQLNILADSALSLRINSEGKKNILFGKNADTVLPIASLTKLMTALVILENPKDFEFSEVIAISKKASEQGNAPNFGSLKEGEKYTLDKLFELMLVYSSNDAAYALSEIIGTDEFIAKMNNKAADLGMENTNFVNPTGLDPDTIALDVNRSTAIDIAILTQYISENHPSIFEYSLNPNSHYSIENGITKLSLKEDQRIVGGKTGFTKTALGCIAFVFEDSQGNKFFNVILRAENEETRISEMQRLVDWISL